MTRKNYNKHKGCTNELLAVIKLMEMGYEVFRNQSQHGLIDIVAIDMETGEIKKFDVKATGKYYPKNSDKVRFYLSKLSDDQIKKGIEPIYVTDAGDVIFQNK